MIVFYDVNERDREQLQASAEHLIAGEQIEYIADELREDTVRPDASVISVFVSSQVGASILDKMPNLKHIACRSTGFNNIDLEAARSKQVSVSNVAGYGEDTVAEYTFGLILSLTRKLPEAIAAAHSGVIVSDSTGIDLAGKTLGIIGTGRIGKRVAAIANGFAMNVLAYDVYQDSAAQEQLSFQYTDLDQLLSQSDIVTLHIPYTEQNHHLINSEKLAKMKHSAYLINTARGELIDTTALINVLQDGALAGAALDVLEGEQLIDRAEELVLLRSAQLDPESLKHSLEINVLRQMPNIIVTKHNAYNSVEAINRINTTTVGNISAFLTGRAENIVS